MVCTDILAGKQQFHGKNRLQKESLSVLQWHNATPICWFPSELCEYFRQVSFANLCTPSATEYYTKMTSFQNPSGRTGISNTDAPASGKVWLIVERRASGKKQRARSSHLTLFNIIANFVFNDVPGCSTFAFAYCAHHHSIHKWPPLLIIDCLLTYPQKWQLKSCTVGLICGPWLVPTQRIVLTATGLFCLASLRSMVRTLKDMCN